MSYREVKIMKDDPTILLNPKWGLLMKTLSLTEIKEGISDLKKKLDCTHWSFFNELGGKNHV